MRANKREQIIDAAVDLIEHRGVDAVTFESLVQASGLSKSGIIYHFPSRHALLLGIHVHLAEKWEAQLVSAAGGPADEVDRPGRLRAVVLTLGHTAPRADLLMALNSHTHPDFTTPWDRVTQAWLPDPEHVMDSELATAAYLVKLMADGLWLHDHVNSAALPAHVRAALIDTVLDRIPRG